VRGLIGTSIAYVVSAAFLRLVAVSITVWLATRMSVQDYGRFGLAIAVQQFVTTLTLGGLVETVIGQLRHHQDPASRDRLFRAVRRACGIAAIPVTMLVIVWALFEEPSRQSLFDITAVAAAGAFLAYATLEATLARLVERHGASISLSTAPALAGAVGGMLFFLWLGKLSGYFLGVAVCSLAVLAVTRWALMPRATAAPAGAAPTRSRELLVVSAPFAGAAVFGWLGGFGNNLLINQIYSLEEVGRYTLTFSIVAALNMVGASLNSVWSPRFYSLAHTMEVDSLERANRAFYSVLAIVLGGVGGGLVILFPAIASLSQSPFQSYAGAAPGLAILAFGYVLLTLWWQASNHILANGAGQSLFRVTVLTGIAGTLVWIGLMLYLGRFGIYIGFAVMMFLRSHYLSRAARKYARTRWPWNGVLAGAALVALGWVIGDSIPSLVEGIALYVVAGLLVFAIAGLRDLRRCLAVW
jgi:O-antigen/teichoic acid export membrane protein